jgi:hypothetical protein
MNAEGIGRKQISTHSIHAYMIGSIRKIKFHENAVICLIKSSEPDCYHIDHRNKGGKGEKDGIACHMEIFQEIGAFQSITEQNSINYVNGGVISGKFQLIPSMPP